VNLFPLPNLVRRTIEAHVPQPPEELYEEKLCTPIPQIEMGPVCLYISALAVSHHLAFHTHRRIYRPSRIHLLRYLSVGFTIRNLSLLHNYLVSTPLGTKLANGQVKRIDVNLWILCVDLPIPNRAVATSWPI
jgi:hypothetical protein